MVRGEAKRRNNLSFGFIIRTSVALASSTVCSIYKVVDALPDAGHWQFRREFSHISFTEALKFYKTLLRLHILPENL